MRLLLVAIGTLCALTAACDGENSVQISTSANDQDAKGILKVVDALQCPETLGVLTRKGSALSGGTTCVYSGPRGAVVSLQLVPLGDLSETEILSRFETTLAADMPRTSAGLKASADASAARMAADEARATADTARLAADDARAVADAHAGQTEGPDGSSLTADPAGDRAEVRLPGMSVKTDGERASVRFGSLSINADNTASSVDIVSTDESVSIRAHDDAAEVRTRSPGEATRMTYLLTDTTASEAGWRLVGYEARGPAGGPIVIATVHAKERDADEILDAARNLVSLNVGE